MAEYASNNRVILLAGRSGSGKSSTGNSILEHDVFDIIPSSDFVTTSFCFLETFSDDDDDHILTVIDTPGSFDISDKTKATGLEIDAVLFVLSLTTRFSVDDSLAIERLIRFFGAKLGDYMIVVFTHGDEMSLDDYLGPNCPDQLAKALEMCGNRFVVFDNVTQDNFEKYQQREELLRLVDGVVANNGGIRYTYELYVEPKEGESEMNNQYTVVESPEEESENVLELDKAYYEDQLLEMESKHREMTLRLEKQLEDEQLARMQAEAALTKSNEEISMVREDLERAQRKARKTKKWLKKMIQEKNIAIEHQIEAKIQESTLKLENQLMDKFARMQAEDKAQEAESKSNDEIRKLREDMNKFERYTENISRMGDEVSSKLWERIVELERQLADEQVGRMQAEDRTEKVKKRANDETNKLREDVERAEKDAERLQKIGLELGERIVELERRLADEEVGRMQAERLQEIDVERILEFERRLADEEDGRMQAERPQNKSESLGVSECLGQWSRGWY